MVAAGQSSFGIELEVTGQVGDGKKQIADFLAERRVAFGDRFRQGFLALRKLLVNLGEDGSSIRPVEPDSGSLLGQAKGCHQRWQ